MGNFESRLPPHLKTTLDAESGKIWHKRFVVFGREVFQWTEAEIVARENAIRENLADVDRILAERKQVVTV
jgi:hypothetical protein